MVKQKIAIGEKFGNWETLSGPFRVDGRTRVKCRCACGTESDVLAYNLLKKKTKQCRDCSSGKTPTILGLSNLTKRSVDQQSKFISGSSIDWDLTPENLSETLTIQGNVCGLTQEPLTLGSSSVVRLDNSEGYNPTNVMVVSTTAKMAMGEMDVSTFVNFAHRVTETVKKNPPMTTAEFFNRRDKE